MSISENLHVVEHPVLKHKITQLRQTSTPPPEFRSLLSSVSTIVCLAATASLPLTSVPDLETPMTTFTGDKIAPRVGLAPILRAGSGMADPMLELISDASVMHLGLFREKISLQPVEYYSKLPTTPTVDIVYILDPLIATGGTAIAAVGMILEWGLPISQIKLVSVLGSKPGLESVLAAHPGLEIWVGAVDEVLSEKGYVEPGLGDVGDRLYNHRA